MRPILDLSVFNKGMAFSHADDQTGAGASVKPGFHYQMEEKLSSSLPGYHLTGSGIELSPHERLSQRRGEKVTALLRRVTPRGAVTALSV